MAGFQDNLDWPIRQLQPSKERGLTSVLSLYFSLGGKYVTDNKTGYFNFIDASHLHNVCLFSHRGFAR